VGFSWLTPYFLFKNKNPLDNRIIALLILNCCKQFNSTQLERTSNEIPEHSVGFTQPGQSELPESQSRLDQLFRGLRLDFRPENHPPEDHGVFPEHPVAGYQRPLGV